MIRTRRLAGLGAALVAVAAIGACHKAPEPQPAPVVVAGPNQDSIARAQAEAARRAAEAAAARRRADSIAAAEAAAREAAGAAARLRSALTEMVHFDYDRSDLRPGDQAILDAKVPVLQANAGVRLRVAGHTDERGSDVYNLALGQRRAGSAKRYLVDHGVAESRIETISYGRERPIAQGHDESAWAQNRRDEFEITAGGNTLRRP
jgi:peptidoglycan-associated lipoprotein